MHAAAMDSNVIQGSVRSTESHWQGLQIDSISEATPCILCVKSAAAGGSRGPGTRRTAPPAVLARTASSWAAFDVTPINRPGPRARLRYTVGLEDSELPGFQKRRKRQLMSAKKVTEIHLMNWPFRARALVASVIGAP